MCALAQTYSTDPYVAQGLCDKLTAAEQAANGWDANDDLHASAEYRRHLATVLTKRALTRAVAVATGQGQPRFGLW